MHTLDACSVSTADPSPGRRTVHRRMTTGHPFATRRGRKIRAAYLAAHPICEPCRAQGKVVEAYEVHHVVPLSQGGAPLDPANFEARCEACHDQVHGFRIKGCMRDGTPLDPHHHWNAR